MNDPEAADYLELIQGAFEQGRQSVLNPGAAYAMAFDHGFGADQEHRPFIAAILEGHAEGTAARKELVRQIARPLPQKEAEIG